MYIYMLGEPQFRQQLVDVFSLVDSLWGDIDSENEKMNSQGRGTYAEQSYRRKRLSLWLKKVNKRKEPKISKEMVEVN